MSTLTRLNAATSSHFLALRKHLPETIRTSVFFSGFRPSEDTEEICGQVFAYLPEQVYQWEIIITPAQSSVRLIDTKLRKILGEVSKLAEDPFVTWVKEVRRSAGIDE